MFVASPGTINLFLVSHDHGLTWEASRSGIRGEVFRQIGIASDWDTSGIAYVITEDGGLQVSTDFGRTWAAPVCDKRLRHLVVPPVAADGTRTLFFAATNALFRSEDGGETFDAIYWPGQGHIDAIAVSPDFETDGTVFVGTSEGQLAKSLNRGKTWQQVDVGSPVRHVEPAPDFASTGRLFLATWGAGVLRSNDGGSSFTDSGDSGLEDPFTNQVRITRDGSALFVCTKDAGVYRSDDGGDRWTLTPLQVDKTTQTENHHTSLTLSPAWPEDQTILCGSFEGLNVSRDGGTTWRESNVNPPRIGRILAVSPTFARDRHVFACGYGMHLLVSPDAAETWDVRFRGINAGSVYSIGPSPEFADDRTIMIGVYKGIRRTEDGGATWRSIHFEDYEGQPRDGQTTRAITYMPRFPADQRVFAIGTRGMFYRSTDGGRSWSNHRVVSTWTTGIALSPDFDEDQTLFVSGAGVHVSTDGGETFEGPIYQQHMYGNYLCTAPDFGRSGELYGIARYDGFVIGHERGARWSPSNEGLEGYAPSAMRLSPDFIDSGRIFVLTNGGGLFGSSDRGRTWQRISPFGSPIDQGFSLAVSTDFANDKTLFVGTLSGFWRSTDGGENWEPTTDFEVYDEKRDPWKRQGDWKLEYGGNPFDNSVSVTEQPGDSMSIEFQGVGCRLLGPRGPDFGVCVVELDGKEVARVDQSAAQKSHGEVLFEVEGLEPSNHRLLVRATGTPGTSSRRNRTGIDALEVRFRGRD